MTTRPHRILVSTQWVRRTIINPRWLSVLAAAAAAIPAIGYIVTQAAETKSESSGPVNITCSASLRQKSFDASVSWQEVLVNGTDKKFVRNCDVVVKLTADTTKVWLDDPDWQPAVLLKVHGLQLLPEKSKCSHGNLTLHIRSPHEPARQVDICNGDAVDALHIWVSEPIQVYLFVWPLQKLRASFSVGFVAARAVDVCQDASISPKRLIVDSHLYVFAPNSAFIGFLQRSTTCSSSQKLRLAADSAHSALDVKVLAVPSNSSCWSLWLDELRISCTRACSFVFGANLEMRYELDNSRSSCNSGEVYQGFTLQFIAVAAKTVATTVVAMTPPATISATTAAVYSTLTLIPGSSELKGTSMAVAIGSSVAAVLLVTAIVLAAALLVIRCRHRERANNSSHQTPASVLGLDESEAERPVHQSMGPGVEHYPHPPSQHGIVFRSSSGAAVPTIVNGRADIVMVDNDLYGTAFGS